MAITFIGEGTVSQAQSVASATPTMHASSQAGDLVIAFVVRYIASAAAVNSAPSGWTQVNSADQMPSTSLRIGVWWKIYAPSGEDTTPTWGWAGNARTIAQLYTFRSDNGFNATNPIHDFSETTYTTSNQYIRAAGINTTIPTHLVFLGAVYSSNAQRWQSPPTVPITMTERGTDYWNTNSDIAIQCSSGDWSSTGAAGNIDSTIYSDSGHTTTANHSTGKGGWALALFEDRSPYITQGITLTDSASGFLPILAADVSDSVTVTDTPTVDDNSVVKVDVSQNITLSEARTVRRRVPVIVSFSFDDAGFEIYTLYKPHMDDWGYPGTAFVVADGTLTLGQMQNMVAAGWEIGNHTADHWDTVPDPTNASEATVEVDIRNGFNQIVAWGFPQPRGFASPGGANSANIASAVRKYHYYNRTWLGGGINYAPLGVDWGTITLATMSTGDGSSLSALNSNLDTLQSGDASGVGGWGVWLFHAWEGGETVFGQFMDEIHARQQYSSIQFVTVTDGFKLMEPNYTRLITVSDSTTVTSSATPEVIDPPSGGQASENITVAESVTVKADDLNISSSDAITLTDSGSASITTEITGSESITVSDVISPIEISISASTSDSVTVTDSIGNIQVESFSPDFFDVSRTEPITITDVVSNITVDSAKGFTTDSVNLSESVSVSVSPTSISVTEVIGIVDSGSASITSAGELIASASESITATDIISGITVDSAKVSVTDAISINESISESIPLSTISVSESIAVSDTLSEIRVDTPGISIVEAISISGSGSATRVDAGNFTVNVPDTIQVTDNATVGGIDNTLIIDKSDTATASDVVSIDVGTPRITVSDSITVLGRVGPPGFSDIITVSDTASLTVSAAPVVRSITRSETVTVTSSGSASVLESGHLISISESIYAEELVGDIWGEDVFVDEQVIVGTTSPAISVIVQDTITLTDAAGARFLRYSDEVRLTEEVTVDVVSTLFHSVNASETVTVSDASLVRESDFSISRTDTVAVSDTTSQTVSEIILSTTDYVVVTDTPTITRGTGNISVLDILSVADTPTILIANHLASASETIVVSEAASVTLSAPTVSTSDTATVSSQPSISISTAISTSDAAAVSDTSNVQAPVSSITSSDSISVSESVSVRTSTGTISVSDAVSVTATVTNISVSTSVHEVTVSDTATVTDLTPGITFGDNQIYKTDPVSVTSSALLHIEQIVPSVSDTSTVSDITSVRSTTGGISVQDTVAVTDTANVNVPFYRVSVSDTATLSEFIYIGGSGGISKPELVVVSDSISLLVTPLLSQVQDTASVTDTPTASITSYISKQDSSSVSDTVTARTSVGDVSEAETVTLSDTAAGFIANLVISVSENATVSDTASASSTSGGVNVVSSVAVTDSVSARMEQFVVSVSDSISVTDAVTVNRTGASSVDAIIYLSAQDRSFASVEIKLSAASSSSSAVTINLDAQASSSVSYDVRIDGGRPSSTTVGIKLVGFVPEIVKPLNSPSFLTGYPIGGFISR